MRFLSYIWAAVSYDTVWAMGRTDIQLMAWCGGMIAPAIFASGICFGFHKTVIALAFLATCSATALLIYWLITLDYWINAPLPTDCGSDACDNDGTIHVLFSFGVLTLPAIITSLLAGPVAVLIAARCRTAQRAIAA